MNFTFRIQFTYVFVAQGIDSCALLTLGPVTELHIASPSWDSSLVSPTLSCLGLLDSHSGSDQNPGSRERQEGTWETD